MTAVSGNSDCAPCPATFISSISDHLGPRSYHYALQMDLSLLAALLMGVVTGVFGGILRDALCNKIPYIFQQGTELYATCSFIGTWAFILLIVLHVDEPIASWIGTFIVFGWRLLTFLLP